MHSPALVALAAALLPQLPTGFTSRQLENVRDRLLERDLRSWELGTAAQALTEYSWPALSVFNVSAFPPPSPLPPSLNASDVLSIAHTVVLERPHNTLALIANEGSAADPASIGVAVLLANWTRTDRTDTSYAEAAGEQLGFLLHDVPRTESGAISHRNEQAQLWADFVYMVPPFIAYFGALQGGRGGRELLQTSYDQCRLYREALRDEGGLWRHIAHGNWQDPTHWATGNAWAAAGMLRVLQTLNHTAQAERFTRQQADLREWIDEILEASWDYQRPNGAVYNVIDDDESFTDTAATALLAAVTYRMAAITGDARHLPFANRAFNLIKDSIDEDGWLLDTTDPYTFHQPSPPGQYSPEGQAFVLLLHSAWRALSDLANE
ncbi:hypothetical protein AX16_000033 [Volvariella volvacea WC 439]|nr:hypothetical protein AX16_000033 [Volvariella volvacea WC 439]